MKNISYDVSKHDGKIIVDVSTPPRGDFDKRVVVRTSQVKSFLRHKKINYGKVLTIGFVDNTIDDALVSTWEFEDKDFSGKQKKTKRKKKTSSRKPKNGFVELDEKITSFEEKTEEEL